MIRVLIADDQALVRGDFRLIIDAQPDTVIVAEAADGTEAIARAGEQRPDVVLMDVRMPNLDGFEATRFMVTDPKLSAVGGLVLTTFDLDEHVYEGMRNGASGCLLKDVPSDSLASAVRTVAARDALLAPRVLRRLIDGFVHPPPLPAPPSRRPSASSANVSSTSCVTSLEDPRTRGSPPPSISRRRWSRATSAGSWPNSAFETRTQAVIVAYETGLVVPGEDGPPSPESP